MLSRTGTYALRAVLFLARVPNGSRVPAARISRVLDVPENYLSKTLNRLAREGVLESTRGPRGGFRLAVPADELTLLEVLDPFESLGPERPCLLGREHCDTESPCAAHHKWLKIARELQHFFGDTTVQELARRNGPGGADGNGDGARGR